MRNAKQPRVLCAASRVYEEKFSVNNYAFLTKSPEHTQNVMRILLPAAPKNYVVTMTDGAAVKELKTDWDAASKTCLLQFKNSSDGVRVSITW